MTAFRLTVIKFWLILGLLFVLIQVMIGGITRLTGSGLSMTSWEPISGVLPPLNEQEWQEEFQAYQQSPEFKKLNRDFTLSEFKGIFWWEYIHRLWARILGLVFIVPFLFFIARKWLDPPMLKKLIVVLLLGASQAVLGWVMVKSGLQDDPWVSPYRLTAHLMLALALFSYLIWILLQLDSPKIEFQIDPMIRVIFFFLTLAVFFQIVYGGFVAGTDAARMYNTFPTMKGQLVPPGMANYRPFLSNFFENPTTVQFIHRYLAIIVSVLVIVFWHLSRSTMDPLLRNSANLLLLAIFFQFTLGVLTITRSNPQQIHIPLAALHQLGAFFLSGIIVFIHFILWRSIPRSKQREEEEELLTTPELSIDR